MTVATVIWSTTQARHVYTCDGHAHVDDAQRVGGPHHTWEGAALVGGRARGLRAIHCDVCDLDAREAEEAAGTGDDAW